jgi:phosphoesterase family protein
VKIQYLSLLVLLVCVRLVSAEGPQPQSQQQVEQGQPEVRKAPEEKKEEAERAAQRSSAHHFDRVLIIVLENGDYEVAVKDKNLTSLAAQGASFSNFHALFHPSYPNYLAMVAGSDFGTHKRGRIFADGQIDFPNDAAHKTIADSLVAAGLDFKNYAEELPEGTCPFHIHEQRVARSKKGAYARKHVPFMSFREVQQKWCDHVVRVDSGNSDNWFVQDAKKGLVAYSFYSPNMNDDGHDTTVAVAGEWVKKFLEKTFRESLRQGTLVIVTFDESDRNADNRIFTLFLGDMVKEPGQQDPQVLGKRYTHYNVLRTIEDNFGLEPLTANDRDAQPITGIWK